jgi:pimeloyl-ACP methyl ester carboxylesterase
MSAETKTLVLPAQRTLAWCEYGSSSSPHPPIFYFHSFPSSRFEGALLHDTALSLDLRIICPDRPGYGLSSPSPTRTFLTYPSDILALAAHLSIPTFRLLSTSGGCSYLLACWKVIPREKCLGAQAISGIYPLKLGMNGMAFLQRAIMFVAYYSPSFVGVLMDWQLGSAARDPDPTKLRDLLLAQVKTLPKRDQEAYEIDGFLPKLLDAIREAFRESGEGAAAEAGLYAREWGFEMENIDARGLTIWHGKQDVNCPFGMAEKAASLLKGVETKFLEEEGHAVVAFHQEEILRRFLPAT